MKLFFDTETTGKANFKLPPLHPTQPRIVQLGALLTDDTGKELCSLDVIIKPDNWVIPSEASAIHGINNELAMSVGVPILGVLRVFSGLLIQSDTLIAHNIDFDSLLVQGELLRQGDRTIQATNNLLAIKKFCTMHATTDICKLPGNYGNFKWPKLSEAYKHILGKDLVGAHDAMTDVRACKEIFFTLYK